MSDDSFPSALTVGFELHGYLVAGVLGQGGFGITYKARDPRLDRLVVIKEYLPQSLVRRRSDHRLALNADHLAESFRDGLESFLQEARTLARFQHPNIVPILDFFEANGTAYLVMPFISGQSLEDRLQARPGGRMPEEEIEQWLRPLLDGLQALHAQGVLHRDLKPDNIIIAADGSPRLIDFGAARNALGHRGRSLSIVLTPGYAPPEQYSRLADNQGPWTDLYALGAVVYRALTGREPPDSTARQDSLVNGDPDPLAAGLALLDGLAGPALKEALTACLRPARRDRVQGVAELRLILTGEAERGATPAEGDEPGPLDFSAAGPVAGGDMIPPPPTLEIPGAVAAEPPVPSGRKRWPALAAVIAAALLLAVGLMYLYPAHHYREGLARDRAGQYDLALISFQKSAEWGYGPAQKILADYYFEGRPDQVRVDPAEARRWMQAAAAKGLVEAQIALGDWYAFGRSGVEKNPREAERWYRMAAAAGQAAAQNYLGNLYESEGRFDLALIWHRRAADQGLPEARNSLSRHYFLGLGLDRDYRQAFGWAQKAALDGVAEAQYRLAHMLENGLGVGRDFSEALVWYGKAAEGGDRSAQYRLAWRYAREDELTRNWPQAFHWAQKAADQGLAEAQFLLADLYYQGLGVGRSVSEALLWNEQSAQQGLRAAQKWLGDFYAQGREVQADPARAVLWYMKAAEQGDLESQRQLFRAYAGAWPGVGESRSLALRWATAAAEQGRPEDQIALARLLFDGPGGEADLAEAVKWYQLAADQGHPEGQFQIGIFAVIGLGRSPDPAEGARWIRLAARQGHAQAQETLAALCQEGSGVPQDQAQALYWYRKAAQQGRPSAQYHLGACYLQGLGTRPNRSEGLRWYQKAARAGHELSQQELRRMGLTW